MKLFTDVRNLTGRRGNDANTGETSALVKKKKKKTQRPHLEPFVLGIEKYVSGFRKSTRAADYDSLAVM